MECEVNSVPGWKLEKVGELIYLPLYWEWTNVAGNQLLTGQAEAQIPGGQPDQISWLTPESSGTLEICEDLKPPHCSLEMGVSQVQHSLGTSSPQLEAFQTREIN